MPLPPITDDISQACSDLREYGIALVSGLLSPDDVSSARDRVFDQASAEDKRGFGFHDGSQSADESPWMIAGGEAGWEEKWAARSKAGPNQRVWHLANKGDIFLKIAGNPKVLSVISQLYSETYRAVEGDAGGDLRGVNPVGQDLSDVILSGFHANIVGKGADLGEIHTDTGYAPFSTPYQIATQVIWPLCDFTEENGATLAIPGSHRLEHPERFLRNCGEYMVPLVAPAGTALIMDCRILHRAGANRTDARRIGLITYYCRPWIRQQENWPAIMSPDVIARCTPDLLKLLGFKTWNGLGLVEGTPHGALNNRKMARPEISQILATSD